MAENLGLGRGALNFLQEVVGLGEQTLLRYRASGFEMKTCHTCDMRILNRFLVCSLFRITNRGSARSRRCLRDRLHSRLHQQGECR